MLATEMQAPVFSNLEDEFFATMSRVDRPGSLVERFIEIERLKKLCSQTKEQVMVMGELRDLKELVESLDEAVKTYKSDFQHAYSSVKDFILENYESPLNNKFYTRADLVLLLSIALSDEEICSVAAEDLRELKNFSKILKESNNTTDRSLIDSVAQNSEGVEVISRLVRKSIISAFEHEDSNVRFNTVIAFARLFPHCLEQAERRFDILIDRYDKKWDHRDFCLEYMLPILGREKLAKFFADRILEAKSGGRSDWAIPVAKYGKDNQAIISNLISKLPDYRSYCDTNTAISLGHFGVEAKIAIPRLLPLLKHDQPFVWKDVCDALIKIGPDFSCIGPVEAMIKGAHKNGYDSFRMIGVCVLSKIPVPEFVNKRRDFVETLERISKNESKESILKTIDSKIKEINSLD